MYKFTPSRIKLFGNPKIAQQYIGVAKSQMNILVNSMKFQNLKQAVRRIRVNDNVYVECRKVFDTQIINIYSPEIEAIHGEEVEVEFRIQLRLDFSAENEFVGFPVTGSDDFVQIEIKSIIDSGDISADRYCFITINGDHENWNLNDRGTQWIYTPYDGDYTNFILAQYNIETKVYTLYQDPFSKTSKEDLFYISANCTNGVEVQYPYRYKTAEKENSADGVPVGKYLVQIPYFKITFTYSPELEYEGINLDGSSDIAEDIVTYLEASKSFYGTGDIKNFYTPEDNFSLTALVKSSVQYRLTETFKNTNAIYVFYRTSAYTYKDPDDCSNTLTEPSGNAGTTTATLTISNNLLSYSCIGCPLINESESEIYSSSSGREHEISMVCSLTWEGSVTWICWNGTSHEEYEVTIPRPTVVGYGGSKNLGELISISAKAYLG